MCTVLCTHAHVHVSSRAENIHTNHFSRHFSVLVVVQGVLAVIQSLSLCCMQTLTLGGISEGDKVTVK